MTQLQLNMYIKFASLLCLVSLFLTDVGLATWFYLTHQSVPSAIAYILWLGLAVAAHSLGLQGTSTFTLPVTPITH